MKSYIYWNKNLLVEYYPNDVILLSIINEHIDKDKELRQEILKEKMSKFQINNVASSIILEIDGTSTYERVISNLSNKYHDTYDNVEIKVHNFLNDIQKKYGIYLLEQDKKFRHKVLERSMQNIYPRVASIEITNNCNLRCKHCYGDYGEIKIKYLTLDQLKKILNDMDNIGVKIVELTGGEATTHPDIVKVLEYAFSLNFEQVSLLTNGVALSDELKELLVKYKNKTFIQIDLQSLDDNYLKWFTGVGDTLHRIQRNISYFTENNVLLRIATSVTNRNINELENIADWIHKKGINHWAVSPIAAVGRAEEDKVELCLNDSTVVLVDKSLRHIIKKYPGLLSIIDEKRKAPTNCGCLTSHIVISSNGDIKICTMDNLQYFDSSIGNVIDHNIKDIYDKNEKFLYEFLKMPSPRNTRDECKDCNHIAFCNGCIIRGLIKAHEQDIKCNWYNNIVSKIIKNKLDNSTSHISMN